jgi:molybdopterin biosynthesis enzyme
VRPPRGPTERSAAFKSLAQRLRGGGRSPPSLVAAARRLRTVARSKLEAVRFPREGAGLLSSLVETDGLVELGEEIKLVEPGQTVGFLSYASLS